MIAMAGWPLVQCLSSTPLAFGTGSIQVSAHLVGTSLISGCPSLLSASRALARASRTPRPFPTPIHEASGALAAMRPSPGSSGVCDCTSHTPRPFSPPIHEASGALAAMRSSPGSSGACDCTDHTPRPFTPPIHAGVGSSGCYAAISWELSCGRTSPPFCWVLRLRLFPCDTIILYSVDAFADIVWHANRPGSTSISRPSHSDLFFEPACLLFESLMPLLRFLVSGLLDRPQIRHATKHRCPAEARMSSPSAGLSRPAPRSLYPIQSCSQTSRQFASCSASDHLLSRRRFSTAMSTSPSTRSPVMGSSGARPAA